MVINGGSAGGEGLKVVASGTLTSDKTVTFQKPATFVLVVGRYTVGDTREFGTVVFATGKINYITSPSNTTLGRLTLSTNGLSMRLTNLTDSYDSSIRYIAIG